MSRTILSVEVRWHYVTPSAVTQQEKDDISKKEKKKTWMKGINTESTDNSLTVFIIIIIIYFSHQKKSIQQGKLFYFTFTLMIQSTRKDSIYDTEV